MATSFALVDGVYAASCFMLNMSKIKMERWRKSTEQKVKQTIIRTNNTQQQQQQFYSHTFSVAAAASCFARIVVLT